MFTGTKMPVFASQRVDGKHVKKYVARKTISRNSVLGFIVLASLLRLLPRVTPGSLELAHSVFPKSIPSSLNQTTEHSYTLRCNCSDLSF